MKMVCGLIGSSCSWLQSKSRSMVNALNQVSRQLRPRKRCCWCCQCVMAVPGAGADAAIGGSDVFEQHWEDGNLHHPALRWS